MTVNLKTTADSILGHPDPVSAGDPSLIAAAADALDENPLD